MTTFGYRRPPKHWRYVPTKREIRQLIDDNAFPVVRVDFSGTSGFPGNRCEKSPYGLGFLEARVVEGEWRFYLDLWSIREHLTEAHGDEIARAALGALKNHMVSCLSRPAAATVKPTQLYLRIAVDEQGVRSESSTKQVDKYSFSTGDWWA